MQDLFLFFSHIYIYTTHLLNIFLTDESIFLLVYLFFFLAFCFSIYL